MPKSSLPLRRSTKTCSSCSKALLRISFIADICIILSIPSSMRIVLASKGVLPVFRKSLLDPPAIHRAISAFFKRPFLHRNFFVRQGAVQRQPGKSFFVTTELYVHRRSAKIFSFSEGFVLKGLPSCCKLLLEEIL